MTAEPPAPEPSRLLDEELVKMGFVPSVQPVPTPLAPPQPGSPPALPHTADALPEQSRQVVVDAPARVPTGAGGLTSESLTAETVLRRRVARPQGGWRKVLYRISGGAINVGPSARERLLADLVRRTRTPLRGCHRVAVISLKGGVGKTTTTAALGATMASLRGDRVIAVDANPDRGTLAEKVPRETLATVRDLLAGPDLPDLPGADGADWRDVPAPALNPEAQRKAEALSTALAKLEPYVGTVWRWCELSPSRAHQYRVGDVVLEPAFVSATRDPTRYAPGSTIFAIASREGRDISALSVFPQDAEVVIDKGALFLVLAVDDAPQGNGATVFLAELPRDLAPTDLSALGGPSRLLLTRMRAAQDQRTAVPTAERHPLSTPDKYTFPVGMDDQGRLRRIVEGSGATG